LAPKLEEPKVGAAITGLLPNALEPKVEVAGEAFVDQGDDLAPKAEAPLNAEVAALAEDPKGFDT